MYILESKTIRVLVFLLNNLKTVSEYSVIFRENVSRKILPMDVLSIFFYLHAATQYTDNTDLKTNYKKKYTDKHNMKSLYSH